MSAVTKPLTYRDMEDEIHDAINMSEATCLLVEDAGTAMERGVLITHKEWETITFAVYHSNKLLLDLKNRWQEIFDSNVAAGKGGAK